ncbi:MBL fold metallo-hydrolase [Candidatus Sumerlaeota bacterium]|nr:MBL fold metallo-hydrolase [Candidatus Sumerlaeota bacterium]
MKITLIYDNEVYQKGLKSDWGFACLVEVENTPRILFDTGANGKILLSNMKKLNIDPSTIEEVFISHAHWDHTGGLSDFLKQNNRVKVYIPASCPEPHGAQEVVKVEKAIQIHENVFSTGELAGVEQSLVVKTEKGLVVVVGCSHPGVGTILNSASNFGNLHAIVGGLHGFNEFDLLNKLELVCACHCTQFKSKIKDLFPQKYIDGGAGKVIEI